MDVALLFHRWDHFFIVRPEYRVGAFRQPLRVGDLDRAFETLSIRPNMAVVLIGWNYDPRDMKQIIDGWHSVLQPYGFKRIVCLYGDDRNKLDGLLIIDDWKRSSEQAKQTTTH